MSKHLVNETYPSEPGLNGTRRQFLGLATAAGAALFATPAPALAASEVFSADLPLTSAAITPWKINIPNAAIDDLKQRLRNARYPEKETVDDTSQGPQLSNFMALMEYWHREYDWRRAERMLNSFPQFRTELDGLGIYFIHVRSQHENALPIILTHGWPGSIVEFYKVIEPLVNPTAFGGDARDAFHVVCPSLPGFGFSDRPTAPGWNVARIARAWDVLMKRLGYSRYVAQGGDWGAAVTTQLAQEKPEGLLAIHLNFPIFIPPPLEGNPTEDEKAEIARAKHYFDQLSGYSNIQKTRPQTIGYALTDSPVPRRKQDVNDPGTTTHLYRGSNHFDRGRRAAYAHRPHV
jgi:pimeloyl-ACP methyl ester carboxylesterase